MRRAEVAGYGVFCGIDVGKERHCALALAADGETVLLSRAVAQDEGELDALFADLGAMGEVLAVVDQHSGFGALELARLPAAAEAAAAMWEAARASSGALPAADVLDECVMADCARIAELERADAELSGRIAALCADVPEVAVARTMPGVGEVYSRTIALEIGDVSRFRSASALAAYVGVGKCPRESGKRRGKRRRRSYNRRLHEAMFESAKIAVRSPGADRDYYLKKLAGEMNEHQALHALVRKRVSIMYAMMRDMRAYRAA